MNIKFVYMGQKEYRGFEYLDEVARIFEIQNHLGTRFRPEVKTRGGRRFGMPVASLDDAKLWRDHYRIQDAA